ncbi:MAG: PstS family phosphate ABC transporter substrate-binding protein [Chitinophagales bacterium]|nr:PstS family phosphate ABC transporter substrate-binding protein [Chitinophagales bacterium]
MKKTTILTLALICLTFNLKAQKIKGSDTVLPLSQEAAEEFKKKSPSSSVSVTGGGSGVGISALMSGTTDIAQASRKIKFDEKLKIQDAGNSVKEIIIALDALSVVVHPSNKVTKLTREQLEGIFTGKITNWKEVGGEDLKIVPYSRETSSGTYEFFKESVLKNKNYKSGIMSLPATGAIIQSVSQTKGAIGYVGFAYLNTKVKSINISYDKGKTYVIPNVTNVKNKTYPIVRPLYYYYLTKNASKVKSFVDYVLSPDGQKIVTEVGYITIK